MDHKVKFSFLFFPTFYLIYIFIIFNLIRQLIFATI